MTRPATAVLAGADLCRGLLAPHTDRDWRTLRPSAEEMTVWELVFHVDDVLYFTRRRCCWPIRTTTCVSSSRPTPTRTPGRLLAALGVNARLLAGTVATADPATLAHHTYGASDPAGFAAMGVVELLVHLWDALRALDPGSDWRWDGAPLGG